MEDRSLLRHESQPTQTRSRGWSWRIVGILSFGFLFAKLVCLGCGLATGRGSDALAMVFRLWFWSEIGLNLWEMIPFIGLAVLDAECREIKRTAVRRGILIGGWVGLLAPLVYGHFEVWLSIFCDGANGTVLLLFLFLPAVAVAGMVNGAGVGWASGVLWYRFGRVSSTGRASSP